MWIRRTVTGWRLALPLQIAGWIVAIGSAGVTVLVLHAAFVVSPIELLYLPIVAVSGVSIAGTARMSVDVTQEGLRIVNPFRTTVVPWADFDRFSVGRWRAWRCMALAVPRSSESIPIRVLTISPFFEDTRVQEAVDELSAKVESLLGRPSR